MDFFLKELHSLIEVFHMHLELLHHGETLKHEFLRALESHLRIRFLDHEGGQVVRV